MQLYKRSHFLSFFFFLFFCKKKNSFHKMKAKLTLHTDKKLESTPTLPYSTQEKTRESRYNKAYSANYSQACSILQAIQLNGRRRLSPHCVSQLAEQVTEAWEMNTNQETTEAISKLMNNLLDATLILPEKSLNEALVEFCKKENAVESVCPSVCLLIAIDYVGRLKQRYNNIKGTKGCGRRLVLVAYMMASKYVHANLKSIINTTTTNVILPPLREQILPSPPTSPTFYSNSNPLNYHYFKSPKESNQPPSRQTTPISRMEMEFLFFLDFDLSLNDTIQLTRWAQNFDALDKPQDDSEYEGDTD
ncbi:unnamed protein product [Rhizopus stolonifer]